MIIGTDCRRYFEATHIKMHKRHCTQHQTISVCDKLKMIGSEMECKEIFLDPTIVEYLIKPSTQWSTIGHQYKLPMRRNLKSYLLKNGITLRHEIGKGEFGNVYLCD